MKPTVVQGLTGRAVAEGQELEVLNKEVLPVLEGVRSFANNWSEFAVAGDTADSPSAWKTVWEAEAIPANTAGHVQAHAIFMDTSGFTAGYERIYGYMSDSAGGLAQTGSVLPYSYETAAAMDFRVTIVGNKLLVQVFDAGVKMFYRVVIRVLEVSL